MKLHALLTTVFLISLISCNEEEPQPSITEIQAEFLAGAKGGNKTWKLSLISLQEGTGTIENFNLPACISDNIYEFTNNADQTYRALEGASKCSPADPDVVEAGNWTFTADGKIMIVLPDVMSYSESSLFTFLTYPSEVIELTDSKLRIQMNLIEEGVSYTYRMTFDKL
jgi:hypothetical protein